MPEYKFPEFPTQYTEEDQTRLEELKDLASRQKQLWQSDFRPDVYETKPSWERALRDRASALREMSFPPGLGFAVSEFQERIPFYNARTFDYVSRETESELQELRRKQEVAAEMPSKLELIAFAYAQGLPIVDETFLYKMFPELNPAVSLPERLELNEEERQWFDTWLEDLREVPKDQLADFFVDRPLSPETWEDAQKRLQMASPQATPTQVMSSVAFSQSNDDIRLALRYAYPAQVEDDQLAFTETQRNKIIEEMMALGIPVTDNWEQNLFALQEKKTALKKEEGIPFTYTDPDTDEKFDAFLVNDSLIYVETSAGRELVGYYDVEKGVYIPLSREEELENLDQIPFTNILEDGTEVQLIYKISDGSIWLDHYEHWYERLVQHSLKIGEYDENGEFVSREPMITELLAQGTFKAIDIIWTPFRLSGTGLWLMSKGLNIPDELDEELSSYSQEEQDYLAELDKGVREILADYDIKIPDSLMVNYDSYELISEAFDLYEDDFEELDKSLREKYDLPAEGSPIFYPSWLEKIDLASSYYQENASWWQQIPFELPFMGIAGKGAYSRLTQFTKRREAISANVQAGKLVTASLAGYEWVVGEALQSTLGQFPKLTPNMSSKVAESYFDKSPGGMRLAEIFDAKSSQYKQFYEIWRLFNREPLVGQLASFNQEAAFKDFNYSYTTDETFRKGFDEFMKWSVTHQVGTTVAEATHVYTAVRASAASASAPTSDAQIIGNLLKDAIEKNIPITAITADMIVKAVPEGVVLTKPDSLIAELKELGYTTKAITDMKPEEAWANVIAGIVTAAGAVPTSEAPIVEATWENTRTGEIITQTEKGERYPLGYEAELDEWTLTRESAATLGSVFKVFGQALTKVPQQLGASILQAFQGHGGASVVDRDWADRFIEDANDDIEKFVTEVSRKYEESPSPIKLTDVAQLPQNIAYSLTSMGAGLGAGIPVGLLPLPGARVAAWATGTIASGAVAYSMTTYQIMQQYLGAKNEESIARTGKGITREEEKQLKSDFEGEARKYGLWEAIPEAISNLAFAKILTTPLGQIAGKKIAGYIVAKLAAMYGQELLTETITQKGQSAIEVEAGLRAKRISWVEAFKEVAPQTFLLTTLLGGAGQVSVSSYNKIKKSLKKEIGESHPLYDEINDNITEDIFSAIEEPVAPEVAPAPAVVEPTVPEVVTPAEVTPEVAPVTPAVTPAPQPVVDIAQRDWTQGQIDVLSFQLKTLTSQHKILKAKIAKTNSPAELKTKQEVLTEVEAEIELFQTNIESVQKEAEKLTGQIEQESSVGALNSLQSELKNLTARRKVLNREIKAIQENKPPASYAKLLKELDAEIAGIKSKLKDYRQKLKDLPAPSAPDKPLASTKSTRAEWNSKKDKKDKLQKAGVESADKITKKDFRTLNPTEQGQAMAAMPELKPSLEEAAKLWNEASVATQVKVAKQAGIPKELAGKKFEELTPAQQVKIQDVIGKKPTKPLIDKDKVASLPLAELQVGGARDTAASVEAATGAAGSAERIVDVEAMQDLTPEEVESLIRNHCSVIADKDNALDVGFVSVYKEGDTSNYFKQLERLPHRDDGTIDYDALVTQAFKDQDFVDAHSSLYNSQPTRDACEYIDGGEPRRLMREVFEVNEHALSAMMFWQTRKDQELHETLTKLGIDRPSYWTPIAAKKFDKVTFALQQSISDEEIFMPTEELLQKPEIAELVKGLSPKDAEIYIEFSRTMRLAFRTVFNEANTARALQGKEAIPVIDSYVPHVWKTTVWGRLMGTHLRPEWVAEPTFLPDYMVNNVEAPFDPRAMARKNAIRNPDLEKDTIKLYRDYVSTIGKEMFLTPAVGNAKAHARFIEIEKGLQSPARYLQDHVIAHGLLGMPESATKAVRSVLPPTIYNIFQWQNQRLTSAVFGANPAFTFVVQPSSLALVPMTTGVNNFLRGTFDFFFNPKLRAWVDSDISSHIQKQKGVAGLKFQDLKTTRQDFKSRFHLSPLESWDDKVTLLVRWMEDITNKIAALSGRRHAIGFGYDADSYEATAHASSVVAKTQSMYDPYHQAGMYPEGVRMFLRFQTFNIEAFTRLRELAALPKAKAGGWKQAGRDKVGGKPSRRIRARKFIGALAIMAIYNLYGDWLSGRRPWEAKSGIPFFGIFMLPLDTNNPWYYPMPMRYAHDFITAIKSYRDYGDWSRFRSWALRWYFPAGVESDKLIDAIIAIAEGGVYEISDEDKKMFDINEEDWWRAVLFGVWSTESAKEWRRHKIDGYPESTQQLLTDLEENEDKLKTEMGYTLHNYRADVLGKLRTEGVPTWQFDMPEREGVTPDLWQIIEDNPFYPPLTIYAALSEDQFKGYYEIRYPDDPSRTQKERREFRREYPVVDAGLVFWEKTKRPLTKEAEGILFQLFDMFEISEPEGQPIQHYEHWSKLPEPPSWAELLPD